MSRHALLIGTGTYRHFPALRSPVVDVQHLAGVLQDHRIGGFEVKSVKDEDCQVVRREIEKFFAGRAPGDVLLLYLSCHGFPSGDDGRLYFAARDTDPTLPDSTAIPASVISRQMCESRAEARIVMLDCCASGAFANGTALLSSRGGGVVMTATNATQAALDGSGFSTLFRPMSLYTGLVVEGLRSGKADSNGDGKITPQDLHEYVREHLGDDPRQSPTLSLDGVGDKIVLARARSAPPAPDWSAWLDRARQLWSGLWAGIESLPPLGKVAAFLVGLFAMVALGAVGLLIVIGWFYWQALRWAGKQGPYIFVFVAALLASLPFAFLGAVVGGGEEPPGTCDYRWSTAVSATELMSVSARDAAQPYTATMRTTQGDIEFRPHTDDGPCGSYAFRYLASRGFFDHRPCPRLDDSGIIDCYDGSRPVDDMGVRFEPDTAATDVVEDSIALALDNGRATGHLVLVGEDVLALDEYEVIGTVTRGSDVIGQIVHGGHDGGIFATGGSPHIPLTITQVLISGSSQPVSALDLAVRPDAGTTR